MSIPPIDFIMKQYENSNVQTTPFLLVKENSKKQLKPRKKKELKSKLKSKNKKKKLKKEKKKTITENRLIPYPPCVSRNLNLKFSNEKKIVKRNNEIKNIFDKMSDTVIKKQLIKNKVISDSSKAPAKLLKDIYAYTKSSNISIHKK